jgi:hypothetical protein
MSTGVGVQEEVEGLGVRQVGVSRAHNCPAVRYHDSDGAHATVAAAAAVLGGLAACMCVGDAA